MELILQYSKLTAYIKKEEKMSKLSGSIDNWSAFQEDESWSVSVFAGRSSRKTYNIALKALRSTHDCLIFVQGKGSANTLHRHMRNIANSSFDINFVLSSAVGSTPYNITLDDGRNIRIIPVRSYNRDSMRGLRFANCDVMFDEFDDGMMLEEFLEWHSTRLKEAHQIICVGTIDKREGTKGKAWFGGSQSQYAIDMPNGESILHNSRYPVHEEIFPSHFVDDYIEKYKETAYFKGIAS